MLKAEQLVECCEPGEDPAEAQSSQHGRALSPAEEEVLQHTHSVKRGARKGKKKKEAEGEDREVEGLAGKNVPFLRPERMALRLDLQGRRRLCFPSHCHFKATPSKGKALQPYQGID